MNIHNTQRIYIPILLGITLLFGIFVTRPLYENYMNKEIEYAKIQKSYTEGEQQLKNLQTMQKSFALNSSWSTDIVKKVNKIGKKWDSAEVISAVMLNEFTLTNSFTTARINIGWITVDKWRNLPSGLSSGTVSLSVSSANLDDMVDYITYLTQNAPYIFTIDEIALPVDTGEEQDNQNGVSLSLSLGVYYYE